MSDYPTLRLGVLQNIMELKARCDAEEGYLRKPSSPYDLDTIKLLEKLFKPKEVEIVREVVVEKPEAKKRGRPSDKAELTEDDAAELEKEAKEMLTELRNMAKQDDGELKQLDTQTKLTIIKTRSSLMEKLVQIRERFTNARKVREFQQVVIGILDDLVEEDRRSEMLKRLEQYL